MSGSGQPSREMVPGFRDRHGHRVLSLTGALDIRARGAVDRQLRDHIEAVRSSVIIVDLSAVTFMDSAGLDPLLEVYDELADLERVLVLRSISAPVARLFRLISSIRPDRLIQQTLGTASASLRPVPTVPDLGASDPDWRTNLAAHLQAAMQAQAVLDQATGLLMGIHECNPEQARLLLGLISRHRDVQVADLAAGIVAAATASQTVTTGVGPNVMVAAGVRAALSTRVPSPRTALTQRGERTVPSG